MVLKLLGAAANFAVVLFLVKKLSITEAGYYFYIFSAVLICSVVARFGMDHYIIREVARSQFDINLEKKISRKIFLLFIITVLTTLIIFFVLYIYFLFFESWIKKEIIVPMVVMAILFQAWANICASILQGLGRSVASGLAMSAGVPIINLFLLLTGDYIGLISFNFFIFALLISNAVTAIIALAGIKSWINFCVPSFEELSELLSDGKEFFVSKILQIGYDLAPVIYTGLLLGPVQIAVFGVSSRVTSLIGYVNTSISLVTAPIYATNGFATAKKEGCSIDGWLVKFGFAQLIISIVLSIFSEKILLIFGHKYFSGKYTLVLLLINQAILYYVTRGFMELQMGGKERVAARISLLRIFVFFLFLWPSSQYFGVEGVASSILLSNILVLFIIFDAKKVIVA